jgi:hypothetical protein
MPLGHRIADMELFCLSGAVHAFLDRTLFHQIRVAVVREFGRAGFACSKLNDNASFAGPSSISDAFQNGQWSRKRQMRRFDASETRSRAAAS